MKKRLVTVICTVISALVFSVSSLASGWVSDSVGYRFQNDDGSFKQNEWVEDSFHWYYIGENGYMLHDQWIDGTYYVGSDGAMLVDTVTPDFYKVDKNGRYIVEDQPIENIELTISANGNDVSVIVAPGGGYTFEGYSGLPNNRLEIDLLAQKGRYFGIAKASQIKLNGAKFEKGNRTDAQKHLRLTVAVQDSNAEVEDQKQRENEEWKTAHASEIDLVIAYIRAGDDENAVRAIRELAKNPGIERFSYAVNDGVGLYVWGLNSNNKNPICVYYGGLIESKREGIEYDREGIGIEYKFFVTDPGKKYDYAIFRGEWHNDAPNGPGTEYRHDKTGIDNLQISGNYVDWYEDGAMTRHYSEKDLTFNYNVLNRYPVASGANRVVATTSKDGAKDSLDLYDCVQTALGEYTGYQKGNSSAVRVE